MVKYLFTNSVTTSHKVLSIQDEVLDQLFYQNRQILKSNQLSKIYIGCNIGYNITPATLKAMNITTFILIEIGYPKTQCQGFFDFEKKNVHNILSSAFNGCITCENWSKRRELCK